MEISRTSHIAIKVQSSNQNDVRFQIKRDIPLKQLMSLYYDRVGLPHGTITFLFDGRTIHETNTPRSIGMEDQDVIDAIINVSSSDVKVKKERTHVIIKVVSQKENEVTMRIKRDTKLEKLMKAYCETVGAQCSLLRFCYNGKRLRESDTPDSLEMEDEDEVDAFNDQDGGGIS